MQNSIKTFKIRQILQKKYANFWERFRDPNFSKSCVGRTTNFEAKVQNYFKRFSYFYVKSKSLHLDNFLDILWKSQKCYCIIIQRGKKFNLT